MSITIKVNTNGPLMISAADAPSVTLTDAEGQRHPAARREERLPLPLWRQLAQAVL